MFFAGDKLVRRVRLQHETRLSPAIMHSSLAMNTLVLYIASELYCSGAGLGLFKLYTPRAETKNWVYTAVL